MKPIRSMWPKHCVLCPCGNLSLIYVLLFTLVVLIELSAHAQENTAGEGVGSAVDQAIVEDEATLRQVLGEGNSGAILWTERGQRYLTEKRASLALSCFTKAIESDKDYSPAYDARADLYSDKGDFQAAVEDLNEVIRLKPDGYSALFNRGLYRQYLRDYDGAISDYTTAADEKTDFSQNVESPEELRAHALHYRGRVYHWYKNQPQRAIDDYSAALKLAPATRMLHYRRGVANHSVKRYEDAEKDFEAALERDPDYPNLLNAWAWQSATCPDAEYRDGLRALRLAQKTQSPQHLAAAHAELGAYDEAIEHQQKLIARTKLAQGDQNATLARQQKHLQQLMTKQPIRD